MDPNIWNIQSGTVGPLEEQKCLNWRKKQMRIEPLTGGPLTHRIRYQYCKPCGYKIVTEVKFLQSL